MIKLGGLSDSLVICYGIGIIYFKTFLGFLTSGWKKKSLLFILEIYTNVYVQMFYFYKKTGKNGKERERTGKNGKAAFFFFFFFFFFFL